MRRWRTNAVQITRDELKLLREEAIKREKFRSYSQRSDGWGRGMTGGEITDAIGGAIPSAAVPILIGLAGEWGVALHINSCLGTNLGVDMLSRRGGDGGIDLLIEGLKIDVKTRRYSPRNNLVRFMSEEGYSIPLRASVYVFCQWNFTQTVTLLGCLGKNDLAACPRQKESRGHCNYVAADKELLPMSRLIIDIKTRREVVPCR